MAYDKVSLKGNDMQAFLLDKCIKVYLVPVFLMDILVSLMEVYEMVLLRDAYALVSLKGNDMQAFLLDKHMLVSLTDKDRLAFWLDMRSFLLMG